MTQIIDAATWEYPELMRMLLVLMETHVLTYMGGLKSKLCNRIRVNFHGKKKCSLFAVSKYELAFSI